MDLRTYGVEKEFSPSNIGKRKRKCDNLSATGVDAELTALKVCSACRRVHDYLLESRTLRIFESNVSTRYGF